MSRRVSISLAILAFIQLGLGIALSPPCLPQEWAVRGKQQGTLKVVNLFSPADGVIENYGETFATLDKDNNWVPGLTEDWRWIDETTIEFKLRKGVTFHNGEKFNAEAVRVNWEEYKRMENPTVLRFIALPDETVFEIIDEYTVRFTFPEPDGIALVKFRDFFLIAPAFFSKYKFDEYSWGVYREPGPWGAGPFKLVEGSVHNARPSDRVVLEAFEGYWDRRYPKVKRIIFDRSLIENRKEAMRLCRETEGSVDIVTYIRPLDTLKVAESPFAKVVKGRDVTLLGGAFNHRKRDSKWKDVRLRRAVNYAIAG